MNPLHYLAYFFGGAFLTNALPHLLAGLMGRPLQTPFATPRRTGTVVFYSQPTLGVRQSRLCLPIALPGGSI